MAGGVIFLAEEFIEALEFILTRAVRVIKGFEKLYPGEWLGVFEKWLARMMPMLTEGDISRIARFFFEGFHFAEQARRFEFEYTGDIFVGAGRRAGEAKLVAVVDVQFRDPYSGKYFWRTVPVEIPLEDIKVAIKLDPVKFQQAVDRAAWQYIGKHLATQELRGLLGHVPDIRQLEVVQWRPRLIVPIVF
jgi:hypothetical protein